MTLLEALQSAPAGAVLADQEGGVVRLWTLSKPFHDGHPVLCRNTNEVHLCLDHYYGKGRDGQRHLITSSPNADCPFCQQIKAREARNERSK